MPSSQRLVSIFLEGLANKLLHANLYAKKHNTLNACIKDAIDFDDNCEIFGNVNTSARSEMFSTKNTIEIGKSHPVDVVEMVMKKMNQVFRPPQRQAEQPTGLLGNTFVGSVEGITLLHNACQRKAILIKQLLAQTNGVTLSKNGQITRCKSAIIAFVT